jgi:acyl-CoA thioester hydrolase
MLDSLLMHLKVAGSPPRLGPATVEDESINHGYEADLGRRGVLSVGVMSEDHTVYSTRWRVRTYELDVNGHVNNAVYLNWVEQVATEHTEAAGFGSDWLAAQGGVWVVRRHEINYLRPAIQGDELELTTRALLLKGARGLRQTRITRLSDGALFAEVLTEWVWIRLSDGRPTRVPDDLVNFFTTADRSSP